MEELKNMNYVLSFEKDWYPTRLIIIEEILMSLFLIFLFVLILSVRIIWNLTTKSNASCTKFWHQNLKFSEKEKVSRSCL